MTMWRVEAEEIDCIQLEYDWRVPVSKRLSDWPRLSFGDGDIAETGSTVHKSFRRISSPIYTYTLSYTSHYV